MTELGISSMTFDVVRDSLGSLRVSPRVSGGVELYLYGIRAAANHYGRTEDPYYGLPPLGLLSTREERRDFPTVPIV